MTFNLTITGRSKMVTVKNPDERAVRSGKGAAWIQVKDESPMVNQYLSVRDMILDAQNPSSSLRGILAENPGAAVTFSSNVGSAGMSLKDWLDRASGLPVPAEHVEHPERMGLPLEDPEPAVAKASVPAAKKA